MMSTQYPTPIYDSVLDDLEINPTEQLGSRERIDKVLWKSSPDQSKVLQEWGKNES